MHETATLDAYGVVTEPATVRIQRLLPGPIERVWAYLTESDLRRQWFAAGEMDLRPGGELELIWRNDELTPHEKRPDGHAEEHRMRSTITRIEPPRLLAFGWRNGSDVTFELEPRGDEVLLTLTHRRLSSHEGLLDVSAGWHAHLDLLVARVAGREPAPFWGRWAALRREYEARL